MSNPTAPSANAPGASPCREAIMDDDLPPNLDECDGLLDVWLSRHGRP